MYYKQGKDIISNYQRAEKKQTGLKSQALGLKEKKNQNNQTLITLKLQYEAKGILITIFVIYCQIIVLGNT